jgi:hypothetical protein
MMQLSASATSRRQRISGPMPKFPQHLSKLATSSGTLHTVIVEARSLNRGHPCGIWKSDIGAGEPIGQTSVLYGRPLGTVAFLSLNARGSCSVATIVIASGEQVTLEAGYARLR